MYYRVTNVFNKKAIIQGRSAHLKFFENRKPVLWHTKSRPGAFGMGGRK